MKNILYLHAGAEMYGADKILLDIVSGLDKKEFRPIVILPNDGVLIDKLRRVGIETYVVGYPILRRKYFNLFGIIRYLIYYFKYSKKISRLLSKKNIKIDLIHVNTAAVLEGIYLKKKLHTKLIWHIHEIILKPKIIFKFISYLIGHYSDKCVAVSQAVKKHLMDSGFLTQNQVEVIYNGIDSRKFNPSINYDYLFKEFKIPRESIRVGMIGRVNSWKGQNDFLDAIEPLLEKRDNLYAFIIGSAFSGEEWRVEKLKKRILKQKRNAQIIYFPFRTDNAAVHNFFDILVLPSTNPDPLPTVVLEAMASGKPIVGYNHGGIVEMVVNGYNGVLCEPCDTKQLEKSIAILATNDSLRIKMGNNSLKREADRFSLAKLINNFSKLYLEIIMAGGKLNE